MSDYMFKRLAEPFPPERVSWRVGSVTKDGTKAMALAYIDARDVMERFDAVCGPAGWERRHPHVGGTTTCELAVWIPELNQWVVKADGAGDTAVEAEKGSLSDSFKRAAVNWGVGRYLYDVEAPWVRIDQYKKILPEELTKLANILRRQFPGSGMAAPPPPPAPEPSARKSSAQAKRDGDHEKIKADISGASIEGIRDWFENFDSYTAHLPLSWLDPIRDQLESRRDELMRTTKDAEAEMDAAFKATVGNFRPPGQGSLAGSANQIPAE